MGVKSAHLCRSNTYPLHPSHVTWIQTERNGVYVKSGHPGALKPDKLGLGCKAGTRDLGVLATHETLPMEMTTFMRPTEMMYTRRR